MCQCEQCEQCPNYLNEVLDVAAENNFKLRGSFQKFKCQKICRALVQLFGTKFGTHSMISGEKMLMSAELKGCTT